MVDCEAVILGVDGVPDSNVLHSRKHDDEVQPYAFDILTLDGEELRPLPLSLRKTNLARLLARRPFSRSPGTGALRRERARERGGRAAAWSTIHADNPTPSPFGTTANGAYLMRDEHRTPDGHTRTVEGIYATSGRASSEATQTME